MIDFPLLSIMTFLPLIGAILILCHPRRGRGCCPQCPQYGFVHITGRLCVCALFAGEFRSG